MSWTSLSDTFSPSCEMTFFSDSTVIACSFSSFISLNACSISFLVSSTSYMLTRSTSTSLSRVRNSGSVTYPFSSVSSLLIISFTLSGSARNPMFFMALSNLRESIRSSTCRNS
eukprot:TRINITY_DN20961_c0_g1_i1.p1 TRINITY_DN20961_c0_g1~~TRINITY_DN20961_c0_g1_i1.p1  ORF type:complete len:114 (+),score=4.00 TRINITY_DN20961_c0_g1_i1:157-498(+)